MQWLKKRSGKYVFFVEDSQLLFPVGFMKFVQSRGKGQKFLQPIEVTAIIFVHGLG